MKYLLVTPEFPPDTGGVARYLGALAAEKDTRLAVASPHGPILFRPDWNFWPRWLPLLWRLPSLIRANGSKVLIISHVLPYGYAALLSGLPYVVICHGLDVAAPRRRPWKRFWAGVALRRASCVVVNSEATKKIVLRYGVRESRLRVIYPPPSWDPAEVGERAETNLAERYNLFDKKVLLIAGRLVPRKGVDVALQIMPKVKERFSDARLLIAGEGPERPRLEQQAVNVGIKDSIIFLGKISDAELRDAYSLAYAVLYPSQELPGDIEGFGIGAADAGLFSKPVIASRTGGLPEAVKDGVTGLLVPPDAPGALLEAILGLLSSPESAKTLGEGGRRLAAQRTKISFRNAFFEALL
ncbi:glycosyltransferase family 1 protein [Patescibacteria group bacterium]|nr:MAG: glycosyltransferase family 1 protein [Patescibacteria group bacterium]